MKRSVCFLLFVSASLSASGQTTVTATGGAANPISNSEVSDPGGLVILTKLGLQSLNNTLYADQFSGATADLKIKRCIGALPTGTYHGGTCDARGLLGAQTIASTIDIKSLVTLILPAGADWYCTATSGSCIKMETDSSLLSFGHGANNAHILLGSGASVSSMLRLGGIPGVCGSHYLVQGVEFSGNSTGGSIAKAVVDISGVCDSAFRNLTIGYFANVPGLYIHDVSSTLGDNSLDFYSLLVDGNYNAGASPVVIEQKTGNSFVGNVRFYGGDFDHPGPGKSIISINGGGFGPVSQVSFYGVYMEGNSPDNGTPVVAITDASVVGFYGGFINRSEGNPFGFAISESTAGNGLTTNIVVDNFVVTGGSSCQSIENSIDSNYTLNSACNIVGYRFMNKNRADGVVQTGPISSLYDASHAPVTTVQGNLSVTGTLTKGAGSFKIDDPLDPTNKYLYHSFVESPDMMNIYNGNITSDKRGVAVVTLPDYFEALNCDFRYQLTVLGQFARAIVAEKINRNRFVIRTDKPLVEVSWQVTGIRHDPYANAHRIRVEEGKPTAERGHYLYPELFRPEPATSASATGSGTR